MGNFNRGENVYFVESGTNIHEGVIISAGSRYTVRYSGISGTAGIKLPEDRIYRTREEAEKAVRYGKQMLKGTHRVEV